MLGDEACEKRRNERGRTIMHNSITFRVRVAIVILAYDFLRACIDWNKRFSEWASKTAKDMGDWALEGLGEDE